MDAQTPHNKNDPVESFIARWQGREGGQERANYVSFLKEMCDALDLPQPDPADATHERNDYVFERAVTRHLDSGDSAGRIDLYRKGSFVLEAKQSRWKGGAKEIAGQYDLLSAEDEPQDRGKRGAARAWDVLMLNAKRQAEEYARALPPSHGWPPFILVCDVGHCIEVYADFTGQGKNYTQFPDRQSFRIYLEDLRKPEVRETLKRIWEEPQALDPTKTAAKVTREIAERLAAVSKAMEAKKFPAEQVAQFLMRCLFTMFASSVKLLPENAFIELLDDARQSPAAFVPLLEELWHAMNEGKFSTSIRKDVLRFNGNLFADAKALPLGREEIGELYEAAQKDWHEVEPAIFGTLLEQALDPAERKRLGAHYTPRAYVERLVLATIIEPLREDWTYVIASADNLTRQAEALAAQRDKKSSDELFKAARQIVMDFHAKLCATRILDPACGTGNFLYVALELMKKLEGDVFEALESLGGQDSIEWMDHHSVDPHQFLGLEINPRAAAIAELVLWIGYLQQHFKSKTTTPPEPILRKFNNIEVKNAVLMWEGNPLPQIIDGKEFYPNAKRPSWPTAEFIVGNPPFIGKGAFMREALGHAQVEALWSAYPHMNESADFVMYWWDKAGDLLTKTGTRLRRFGLVTTNSISQVFNRRVMESYLNAKQPISLVFAIPDHPWTKATDDAAAVRIAMTVAEAGSNSGLLRSVTSESALDTDTPEVSFDDVFGKINSDLTVGVDITNTKALKSNEGVSSNGMMLAGAGFIVSKSQAEHLGLGKRRGLEGHIREYRNGRDLTTHARHAMVIDMFGLTPAKIRKDFPEVYQHLVDTVKPERDNNRRVSFRENWWRFGEPRKLLRGFIEEIPHYIATVETTKHRVFQFLPVDIVPDHMLIAIGLPDGFFLGVLSSKIHAIWALRAGGWLGVGNDPRYSKSKVFDPFPFPSPGDLLKSKIRAVAEELDAFRKERQKEHPLLTMTQMYNVLEKLKANADLDDDDERIKKEGLILILKELHEKLNALVFEAYGWPATLTDEQILEKLVALNHERAAEEKRGHVRWLRPDYQIPRFGKDLDKMAAKEEGAQIAAELGLAEPAARKASFPADAVSQTAAVFAALAATSGAVTVKDIAAGFRGSKNLEKYIGEVLASLTRLGHVTTRDGKTYSIRRAA
jgi:hypothetical protein